MKESRGLFQLSQAFALGRRDAYIHFPVWCDDLEHRMMSDWIHQTADDTLSWLDVREAAYQGWQERQERLIEERGPVESVGLDPALEDLRARARAFGASDRYQRFPRWSDDLEYKLEADWKRLLGGVPFYEVRAAIREGWETRRARPVSTAQPG
jgi:hypothetical protein